MQELSISHRAALADVKAFRALLAKIARASGVTARQPMSMYRTGGVAMHFYTGARRTDDVDAVFDRRILIPADACVIYREAERNTRMVYSDVN
jgi:hypothetical protein